MPWSPWTHVTPAQTVVVGSGALHGLAHHLDELGVDRIALMASARSARSAQAAAVRTGLAGRHVVAEVLGIDEHAPVVACERLAHELAVAEPQAIVAFGGGSVSDAAKAVALLLAEGGPLVERCGDPPAGRRPAKIPLLAVPTTLSGAEVTPGGAVVDEDGVKHVFWDQQLAARVVLLDPAVLALTPQDVLLSTGMNGLAHCAEAFGSAAATPVTVALAREGAVRFVDGLLRVARGDRSVDVLADLQGAAALGGMVISNAGVGIHHAVCHVLGGLLRVPHGVANAIVLPHALAFNAETAPAGPAAFADAIRPVLRAHDIDADGDAPALVGRLQQALGVPTALRDLGVPADALRQVAVGVMDDGALTFNPRRVDRPGELEGLLRAAWEGGVA
jgi:alcohol dehydrogenase